MSTSRRSTAVTIALALALAGCGGAPATPRREPRGWAALDRAARQDYMGLTVLPRMQALFQRHDPEGFTGFRCQTCHGDGFDKPPIDFAMPSPALLALDPADPVADAMTYDPAIAAFMRDEVVPAMATLLGAGRATSTAPGCFGCHPRAPAP